jgi:ribonuclease HI
MGVLKNHREVGIDTRGIEDFKSNIDIERQKDSGRREFAFGMSLSLGIASNNYAEYSGLIIAQLIFSMFK